MISYFIIFIVSVSVLLLSALKENSLFEEIDWNNIHNTAAPFVPNPDDDTDTSYFIGTLNIFYLSLSRCYFQQICHLKQLLVKKAR